MNKTFVPARLWIVRVALFSWLAAIMSVGSAQAAPVTVTYVLDNAWLEPYDNYTDNPYGYAPQQMTGSFEWTYEEGDFENGSGQFNDDLVIPWYDSATYGAPNTNIGINSIEFTFPGNYHDLGLDLTLFLLDPLSLDLPAFINTTRSEFDIQDGLSTKGHVMSGSILPSNLVVPVPAAAWLFSSGILCLVGIARRKKAG